jgi:hypothetical protein
MTGTMNSETVSEKPRRGRRPGYVGACKAELFATWTEVRTVRSLHNKIQAASAYAAMADVPGARERWQWILGSDNRVIGKNAVLTELGRLDNPETIFAFADRICELAQQEPRMTAKDAAGRIRRIRMEHAGRKPKRPSVYHLSEALLTTVDNYRAVHPDMSLADVLDAISTAYNDVAELVEEERS